MDDVFALRRLRAEQVMEGLQREIESLSKLERERFGSIRCDLVLSYQSHLEEIEANPALAAKYEEMIRVEKLRRFKK